MECCVCDAHFNQCSLEHGHKGLHECTIPPPDEYWEDEKEEEMPVTDIPTTKKKGITLTLTFASEAEIQLYESLEKDAENDERPLTLYVKRLLRSAYYPATAVDSGLGLSLPK